LHEAERPIDESGQGLVEYLLIVALIALAATAGMTQVASYINSAFIRVGQKLGGYVSQKRNTVKPIGNESPRLICLSR
jgi:Flp pilus assembly pilin Flp